MTHLRAPATSPKNRGTFTPVEAKEMLYGKGIESCFSSSSYSPARGSYASVAFSAQSNPWCFESCFDQRQFDQRQQDQQRYQEPEFDEREEEWDEMDREQQQRQQ